ncbi:hypothetical protein ODV97_18970 [Enterococcus gallinarum]|nr:hypothetical protein [Enterococcus gallinarum]
MEQTETAHAEQIKNNQVNLCPHWSLTLVGVVFSRNSERIVKERGYRGAYYEPFHQVMANKQSRILSNSALCRK